MTVAGRPGNVFAFRGLSYANSRDDIQVGVSGEARRMKIGEGADFPADGGVWRVIFKQARADRGDRMGFDVVFVPDEG